MSRAHGPGGGQNVTTDRHRSLTVGYSRTFAKSRHIPVTAFFWSNEI